MILDDTELAISELRSLRSAGGSALVECTVPGWGRNLALLRNISEASGIHIIASSGFYTEACHPASMTTHSIEDLADELVCELTEGERGTGIKTGVLKVAVNRPKALGNELKALRIVARAQRQTGVAITTHTTTADYETTNGEVAWRILDVLGEEGVDFSRVIIGHLDERIDIRELERLYACGVYLQFDLIGKEHFMLDKTRVTAVKWLAEAKMTDRLLLSMDCSRKSSLEYFGGPGYRYLYDNFIPRLIEARIPMAVVNEILIENPARVLSCRTLSRTQ